MVSVETPNWLTKDFLKNILERNQCAKDVEILKFTHISAVPKWTNYLSQIIRISIEYSHNLNNPSKVENNSCVTKTSLILKIPLQDGDASALNKTGIIEKETAAYRELLPKMHDLIRRVEKDIYLAPKYYECDLENIIVLEDLKTDNYIMADRRLQLDYDHVVMLLKKLAKFHAASVRLHETDPEFIKRIGSHTMICKNMDAKMREIFDPLIGPAHIEMIRTEFEKWPETRKYVDFLTKLKPQVWDLFIKCIYPDEDEFTALNHGDLWTNNVMFKRDDNGKPLEMKFIDLQMLRYTSPSMDLINFLHTSVSYDTLKEHFNEFIKIYLTDLNRNLKNYGSRQQLSEEAFGRSLEKRKIFKAITCINSLPFVFGEKEDIKDSSELNETENAMVAFVKNKTYRSTVIKYLDDFSQEEWFQKFK